MRFLLIVTLLFLVSCSSDKPANFPKLYPLEIELTQDNQPASDVIMTLVTEQHNWSVGGTTDNTGKAKLYTHGRYFGVPEGEYKIVLLKEKVVENPKAKNSEFALDDDVYSLISKKYTKQSTTPLSVTVEKNTTKAKFELGPPVKEKK